MAVTAVLSLLLLREQFPCTKPRAMNKSQAPLDVCWDLLLGLQYLACPTETSGGIIRVNGGKLRTLLPMFYPGAGF